MQPSKSLTLYDLESTLVALQDSLELLPPEDQEARLACLNDLAGTNEVARNKRDAVARFIRHLAAMEKAQDAEIADLRARRNGIENMRKRISAYVVSLIKEYAPERAGSTKRLEGDVRVLRIQKNPRSVKITDEASVPDHFKRVTVVMNWATWKLLIKSLGLGSVTVERADLEVMKSWIATALEEGRKVDGAEWEQETHHLRIE